MYIHCDCNAPRHQRGQAQPPFTTRPAEGFGTTASARAPPHAEVKQAGLGQLAEGHEEEGGSDSVLSSMRRRVTMMRVGVAWGIKKGLGGCVSHPKMWASKGLRLI